MPRTTKTNSTKTYPITGAKDDKMEAFKEEMRLPSK
jgi:hypothetical protein